MSLKIIFLSTVVILLYFESGERHAASAAAGTFSAIFASKRSAAVLNQLILDSLRQRDQMYGNNENDYERPERLSEKMYGNSVERSTRIENTLNLERRGPKSDRRTSIRCYFNVVSCF